MYESNARGLGKGSDLVDDEAIINMLFERNEKGLAEISEKYSRLCKSIIGRILSDERDVEECAADVLMAVWDSIPPHSPSNLPAYLCRVSKNIGINKLRYNEAGKRAPEYTVMLDEIEECLCDRAEESENIGNIISEFVKSLDAQTRILFIRRYVYMEDVSELAERFRLSENYISVKLYRARKKLKKLLDKEDIWI